MSSSRRVMRYTGALFSAIFAIVGWATASAQTYPAPATPIRIIVPFAAGGITDIVARALAQRLTEAWGEQVIVEN